MRIFKIILISILALLIVLAIGTFIFVKRAFTPDPNYLELTESSGKIPIHWSRSEHSEIAAILLPIKIEGIPRTFHLQFDTGAPSSRFYKNTILAIREKYPNQIAKIDSTSKRMPQSFHLGEMKVYSKQMRIDDAGRKTIDWSDTTSIITIGTLGADMIDKKLTVIDFKNNYCFFGEKVPELGQEIQFHDLVYKGRRTLYPTVIEGKKGNLMHDTGTSGFELITNKKTWKKLAKKDAQAEEAFKVKSWKKQLTAFNIASDKKIVFPSMDVKLNQVTYIEGASFMQSAIVRMTRLGGMIGNQVFMGKTLILDCRNKRYALVELSAP